MNYDKNMKKTSYTKQRQKLYFDDLSGGICRLRQLCEFALIFVFIDEYLLKSFLKGKANSRHNI